MLDTVALDRTFTIWVVLAGLTPAVGVELLDVIAQPNVGFGHASDGEVVGGEPRPIVVVTVDAF